MPSRVPQNRNRYRLQAEYALDQLRQAHASGNSDRFEECHRTWSLAAAVSDAELTEQGGGARLLRRKNVRAEIQLRPLPPELQALLPQPTLPLEPTVPESIASEATNPALAPPGPAAELEPEEAPALLPLPNEGLKAVLLRRGALLQALHAGGPNPFPAELSHAEWGYHLTVFQEEGAAECELLQQIDETLEVFLEQEPDWPEPEEGTLFLDEQHGLTTGTDPVCLEIYRESLAELTETELRADLYTCLEAGRGDTVALIETEIERRERETEPEWPENGFERTPERGSEGTTCRENLGTTPALSEPPAAAATPETPRRRKAVYSTTPPKAPKRPARSDETSAPAEASPEPDPLAYSTTPAWIDAAGRTRTWSLLDPAGGKVAEITTKRDAEKMADFLNGMRRPPSPEL